jgi:hypothetical protein
MEDIITANIYHAKFEVQRDIRHGSAIVLPSFIKEGEKKKRKRIPCLAKITPCPSLPIPARFSSPLWSVALSVPAGWHLPYLVFRPSV